MRDNRLTTSYRLVIIMVSKERSQSMLKNTKISDTLRAEIKATGKSLYEIAGECGVSLPVLSYARRRAARARCSRDFTVPAARSVIAWIS